LAASLYLKNIRLREVEIHDKRVRLSSKRKSEKSNNSRRANSDPGRPADLSNKKQGFWYLIKCFVIFWILNLFRK
jgi:hypothetical protein